jgi:transcriptional regulator with XRE-family HTH domain
MKHPINSAADLGLVIRAVRKSTHVRQDDLAGAVRVSRQFTHDVEQGKPTVQLGRVLLLLRELGIALNVDIPDEASRTLATLQPSRPRARRNAAQRQVARVDEAGEDSEA